MSTLKLNDKATRFFIYSYLGIDINDDITRKEAIKACVRRAYLDMCRTLNIKEEWANKKTDIIKDMVKAFANNQDIKNMRTNAYKVFFDEKGIKREVVDCLNNLKGTNIYFSYGHAQKWINMTLKYMWLLGLVDGEQLDVPIDSYVYKAAQKSPDETIYENDVVKGLGIDPICKETSTKNGKVKKEEIAWSRINQKEYNDYQGEIREKLDTNKYKSPIEWEFDAWIAQAKKENKNK